VTNNDLYSAERRWLRNPDASRSVSTTRLAERLADYLQTRYPEATEISVSPLVVAGNGFSNENWFFDARWMTPKGKQSAGFVARAQVPGREVFFRNDLFLQSRMMEALGKHSDVRVPVVHLTEPSDALIGRPFFVMGRVDGKVPANGAPGHHGVGWTTELSSVERAKLYQNAIEVLVNLHSLDWRDGCDFLDHGGGAREALPNFLQHMQDSYIWAANGRRFPVMEKALAWLVEQQPAITHACVTWGDARVGNMIFGDDLSVKAVLDWEMAALLPPEIDVVWWLMLEETRMANAGGKSIEGAPTRDETIQVYESLSGRDLQHMDYFEVLGRFRRLLCTLRIFCPDPGDDTSVLETNTRSLARLLRVSLPTTGAVDGSR